MDRIQSEDIRNEPGIISLIKRLEENMEQWKILFECMVDERIPKEITKYKPHSKRDIGRPLKKFWQ